MTYGAPGPPSGRVRSLARPPVHKIPAKRARLARSCRPDDARRKGARTFPNQDILKEPQDVFKGARFHAALLGARRRHRRRVGHTSRMPHVENAAAGQQRGDCDFENALGASRQCRSMVLAQSDATFPHQKCHRPNEPRMGFRMIAVGCAARATHGQRTTLLPTARRLRKKRRAKKRDVNRIHGCTNH